MSTASITNSSKTMTIEITDLAAKNQLLHLVVNSQREGPYKTLERSIFSYISEESPEIVCEVIRGGFMYGLLTIGAEYGFDEIKAFEILRAYILNNVKLDSERIRDWVLSILVYAGEHNGDVCNIARNISPRAYRALFEYSRERGSLDNDIHLLRKLNAKYPEMIEIWNSAAPNGDILHRLTDPT